MGPILLDSKPMKKKRWVANNHPPPYSGSRQSYGFGEDVGKFGLLLAIGAMWWALQGQPLEEVWAHIVQAKLVAVLLLSHLYSATSSSFSQTNAHCSG